MFGSSRKSKRVRLLKLKLWSLKFKLNEFESLQTSVNTERHGATVRFTAHIFYHTLFLRQQSGHRSNGDWSEGHKGFE